MSQSTDLTLGYYNDNAEEFIEGTLQADMHELRDRFLERVPEGGMILDFGCGSGRDSKAFLDDGYRVVSLDGSPSLCTNAQQLLGQAVICCKFQDYWATSQYDGIWACASLLHLKEDELQPVIDQLIKSLNQGSPLYMSFKYGDHNGVRNGRWFTDMTENRLQQIMQSFPDAQLVEQWVTEDVRPERTEKWLNSIYVRTA